MTSTTLAEPTEHPAGGRRSPSGRIWRHCPESGRWWLWWWDEWKLLPDPTEDSVAWALWSSFCANHGLNPA